MEGGGSHGGHVRPGCRSGCREGLGDGLPRVPGPRGRRRVETRTFKTTTGSLQVMRDWLLEEQASIAAMESTSTYWKPPFYCLEEVMDVWLLNAAHMKAVPGPQE